MRSIANPSSPPSCPRRGHRPFAVAVAVGVGLSLVTLAPAVAAVEDPITLTADDAPFSLVPVGTYATGVFDESAAEIVAYDVRTQRLFTVNAQAGQVDVIDASNPAAPVRLGVVDAVGALDAAGAAIPDGAVVNSVAVRRDGLGVLAVQSPVRTDAGWLVAFDARASVTADGALATLGAVQVGALPDMVALSADGRTAVVANEGEPSDDFTVDPEGSVSVVALPRRVAAPAQADVRTADFHAFEATGALPEGVRVFGPTVSTSYPVSANLEPEYVTIDGRTAYVTLQEANAIAVVDLRTATVTNLLPLAAKDYGQGGNGLDPSDRDGVVDIRTVPGLLGLPMPDTIASYVTRGRTYLVTANEGDAREWGTYVEGARVGALGKNGLPGLCADNPLVGLTANAQLGRLNVTTASGLSADGTCFEQLYTFGTRSFSIWDTAGTLVFDSGDAFEQITAEALPAFFNSNHTASNLEGRSDDKGPEPEGLAIGQVRGRTYAFVGFERVGGVAVFDITVPAESTFVTYVNNRDLAVSVEDGGLLAEAGDLGPEGLTFLPAGASPTRQPMLAVANEVSGTTTLFGLELLARPGRGH